MLGAEDLGGGEHAHEAMPGTYLGRVQRDLGDYSREGGAAAAVEVYGVRGGLARLLIHANPTATLGRP